MISKQVGSRRPASEAGALARRRAIIVSAIFLDPAGFHDRRLAQDARPAAAQGAWSGAQAPRLEQLHAGVPGGRPGALSCSIRW